MTPVVQDFLLDWLAKMVIWFVILLALTCLFFIGRWSGRLAERRAWNRLGEECRPDPVRSIPVQREGLR